ncbi:MAG: YgjV family protein [Oscillospiraceae bacterium]|nr:YgjV family protein [Oscillospiraceae bacterium]
MNLYLELFGYMGTALVLMSMMMTSMTKLRFLNIAGSVVSLIYAAVVGTWPVVLLNLGMIVINCVQLLRTYRGKLRIKEEML